MKIKNEADPILRDGEGIRVPMLMMDGLDPVQIAVRDANEYGSLGPGNAGVSRIEHPDPGVNLQPGGGEWTGNPDATKKASQEKGPALSKAQAAAEEAYEHRNAVYKSAWKTK